MIKYSLGKIIIDLRDIDFNELDNHELFITNKDIINLLDNYNFEKDLYILIKYDTYTFNVFISQVRDGALGGMAGTLDFEGGTDLSLAGCLVLDYNKSRKYLYVSLTEL